MSLLTIQGSFTAAGAGQLAVNIGIDVPAPVCSQQVVQLASGYNTVNIPSGTTIVIVRLPSANAQTIVLKGPTGDTGIPINSNGLAIFTPSTGATTFGITAGGADAHNAIITFL